jgi:hypothetical protein
MNRSQSRERSSHQRGKDPKIESISSPTQEEELDEEISNLESIHQQVEKRREKMLRLSEL